jgi:hypothetical protein
MVDVTQTETGATNIDIELPAALQEFLAQPRCVDLALPEPGSVKLELPTGGTLKGVADITKGIPTDCSLSFSLMLQLGPILANLECIIRVLRLIEPLIDVIKGLPFPPAEAIKKFVDASVDVGECIVKFTTPVGMLPFVRDILCLIIKILGCLIDQLKSIVALMGSLSLQFEAAQGNDELLANLECAQQNAQTSINSAMQAFEPVLIVLELVAPLMEIAQVGPIEIPTIGSTEDVEQIEQVIGQMEDFVDTLQLVADAAGGCD